MQVRRPECNGWGELISRYGRRVSPSASRGEGELTSAGRLGLQEEAEVYWVRWLFALTMPCFEYCWSLDAHTLGVVEFGCTYLGCYGVWVHIPWVLWSLGAHTLGVIAKTISS